MGSLRADVRSIRKGLRSKFGEREPKRPIFRALMGDGTGGDIRTHCRIEDDPNRVYVRVVGRGVMEAAYNWELPARHDLPVFVGPTQENPDVLEVLGIDQVAITTPGNFAYVPHHHQAHELHNTYGGDDVVWVQKQQFLPFLGAPLDPVTMECYVYPGFYLFLTDWQYFPGGNADMTGHLPAAGMARYVLVSINAVTNTLVITDGADFAPFPPTNPSNNIPACPAQHFPIVAIYLLDSTTEVDWENLYDVRLMVGGGVNTEVPGPHHLLDSVVHDDTSAHHVPAEGDLVYGFDDGADIYWAALGVGASNNMLLKTTGGILSRVPTWDCFDWDGISSCPTSDMAHNHSSAAEGDTWLHEIDHLDFDADSQDLGGAVNPTLDWYSYVMPINAPVGGSFISCMADVAGRASSTGSMMLVNSYYDSGIGFRVTLIDSGACGLGSNRLHLASGDDYMLGKHPLLFVKNATGDGWYEIGWSGASGGVGAHDLLSATHSDTDAATPPGRGSVLIGSPGNLWRELPSLGWKYHFQTDDDGDPVWDRDIIMQSGHWIGLGDFVGYGTGEGRIKFEEIGEAYVGGLDGIYVLDANLGVGTETPNIAGEALALTIEAQTGAPTLELSLRDDLLGVNQVLGIIRWFSGDVAQCAQGQIDVIQSGWYETGSTMRFWAADDCALCLALELDCSGATFWMPIFLNSIKSGATQGGAGAATNELWKTSGHATLPDDVVMIGV